ncbi:MAG: 3'-5' exonuclease, partial [Pseudomonadota bacterium]
DIALLLGLPGKMGHSGAEVWEQFQQGNLEGIRNYCETDVLNTYLVYLRYELMRGNLDDAGYRRETKLVRDTLAATNRPHLNAFLAAWPDAR